MQFKKFNETEIFKNEGSTTYEYNIIGDQINYCIVELNGRTPPENVMQ